MSVSSFSNHPQAKRHRSDLDSKPIAWGNLDTSLQYCIAKFLPSEEARAFLGKKGSFTMWQKFKEGIDISDWPARGSLPHLQQKWDLQIFPRMCKQIEKVAGSLWVKSLRIEKLSDQQLARVCSFPLSSLQSLSVQFSSERDDHLPSCEEAITKLAKGALQLTRVRVEHFTDQETVALIRSCKNLTSLTTRNMVLRQGNDRGWLQESDWGSIAAELAKKPSFQSLELGEGCNLSPHQVSQVAKIPQLRNVAVIRQDIDDKAFEVFAGHPNLRKVRLDSLTSINNRTLEIFSKLPSLTSMEISFCPRVDFKAIFFLKGAAKLSHLVLQKFKMEDLTFMLLSQFPSLTSLRLIECAPITNEDLEQLGSSKLRKLEILTGDETVEITDEGLVALASERLEHFTFRKPKKQTIGEMFASQAAWKNITSEGVRKFVQECKNLRTLDLPGFSKKLHLQLSSAGISP